MEGGEDMNVVVGVRIGRVREGLRACIRRRLELSLARFGDRVAQVTVRVSSREATSLGRLYVCRAEAELLPSGGALVEEVTDHDLHRAVDLAADRLGRALRRTLAWDGDVKGAAGSRHGHAGRTRPMVGGTLAAHSQVDGRALQGTGR
jgi:ribosome-associated translation inhibitor RaiA